MITKTSIPICLITDTNYVLPTKVCLESMKQSKNDVSNYEIYIISDNLEQNDIYDLEQMSSKNFIIKVINVDNPYKNLNNLNDFVTNSAFLKFDIPFILNQFDKILYLDTDIVVLQDLQSLYNTEISDTYAGVVLDIGELFYKYGKKINVCNYFNSGVLLFNATKCRKDCINIQALQVYKNNGECFICHDQDTLNIVFNNSTTLLSPKFNFQQSITEYPRNKVLKYYNVENREILKQSIVIMHYTRLKPWKYKSATYGYMWYRYFKQIYPNKNLNMKSGILLKFYFWLRGHFNLRLINRLLKRKKIK